MSEELHASASIESDSTLTPDIDSTPLSADKIIEILNSALVELKETRDYLSYATIIEIHLQSKQNSFDPDAKVKILSALYQILSENPDIVYEIGWDLPSLMIEYLFSKWDLKEALRDNAGICQIIKIFELLSLYGNPKEIFLRSCELLNSMKFQELDIPTGTPNWGDEFYYKLSSHNLIELLVSSLNRIKTLYPSRFLSKLIITLTNFLNNNFEFVTDTRIFIFRRYYVFIRQYSGLPLPDKISETDQLDLDKIVDDENYLQRKLVTSFLTYFISMSINLEEFHWTYNYYNKEFHNPNSKFRLPELEQENTDTRFYPSEDEDWDALLLRCSQLAESMDMDLEQLFMDQITETETMFAKLDHSQSMDVLNDQVYSLVINNYNEKVKPHNKIPLSDRGILYMITDLVNKDIVYTKIKRVVPITFEGLIKLTINYLIPTLINPSLSSKSLVDAIIFWSWYCIRHDLNHAKELKMIKPVFIHIYLQNLIHLSSMNPNPAQRIILFTLITKTLTMADEELSWNFIVESIETCPYDNARLALIGILKDLLIRHKSINGLTESLKSINLNDSKKEEKTSSTTAETKTPENTRPKLPARVLPTYITLTPTRQKQLLLTLDKQIDEFFTNYPKNKVELSVLVSFVNLLIAIKSKMSPDQVEHVTSKIEKNIELISVKNKDNKDENQDINISLLLVAVESLKK